MYRKLTVGKMKTLLLVIVFVTAARAGELLWGDATEITNNGLFSLQCQHDGKFLTAAKGGVPARQEWFDSPNQKFIFTSTIKNEEASWKITPIDQKNELTDHYKIKDVGHGKYQLKNLSSGKCLRAQGRNAVVESECINDDPMQRWFAAVATFVLYRSMRKGVADASMISTSTTVSTDQLLNWVAQWAHKWPKCMLV